MNYLIDKLISENSSILKRRPDLHRVIDWTEDGKKLFANDELISKLNKLPIRLVIGNCTCGNRIVREDVIKYCAFCHKKIDD